jgi:hypothetical protein
LAQERIGPRRRRLRPRWVAVPVFIIYATVFLYCAAISGSACALAQSASEPIALSSILISASITGPDRKTSRSGAPLGLRVDLAETSSADALSSSAKGTMYTLPRASLFQEDGTTPKRIEVVVWLDPRHFSLKSGRHGLLALDSGRSVAGHYDIVALSDTGDVNEGAPKLRLYLRKAAPSNETSTVGILLLADDEPIADLSLPLKVTQGQIAPSQATSYSPFRPNTLPGNPSDNGALTLIELHDGEVQLTFVCAEGMRSWRVVNNRPLRDWPKYVDEGIAEAALTTAASTFRDVLFPTGSRCKTGCTAAAALFNTWARRAASAESPPTLTVRTLPLGKDETFAPVLMPVGVLPVTNEVEQLALPDDISNEESLATPADATPLPDPALQPELMGASASDPLLKVGALSDELEARGEEAVAISADLQDPANPESEANAIALVIDPVAAQKSQVHALPSSVDIEKEDDPAPDYLAYKLLSIVPLQGATASAASGACANSWSVLLPPDVKDPDGGLDAAREQMRVLLDMWQAMPPQPSFQYKRSLRPHLTRDARPEGLTGAWLIVSHYNNAIGFLKMPSIDGSSQEVNEEQLKRKLASPGVVVLLACETAVPATHTFLRKLIDNGAVTLIATSALLPGRVAGQFATAFIGVLGEAGTAGISVADAFWETLKRLPPQSQYAVPRFILAGDPNVRLCAPPLVR